MIARQVALVIAVVSPGAALCTTLADQRARFLLGDRAPLAQQKPAYSRFFAMQASLAVVGFLVGGVASICRMLVSRTALALCLSALILAGCTRQMDRYVDLAQPDPNELLTRMMEVASSGGAEKPDVLEHILGLRLEAVGHSGSSSGRFLVHPRTTSGPAFLDAREPYSVYLRSSDRPEPYSWRAFLEIRLDTNVVCLPIATVIARYGARGEWRSPIVSGFSRPPDFYAVLASRSPYTEVWFKRARTDETTRLRGCVGEVQFAVDCARGERCGGVPTWPRNDAVFRRNQIPPRQP